MSAGTSLSFVVCTVTIILAVAVSFTQGGCEFKKSWIGRWFLSGVPNLIYINSTHIETKGECYEEQGDKYLVYEKSDNCYRCMAIHEKHETVLQYKETFCEVKGSLQDICYGITGDAPLYSMFRKHPEVKPVACPFKSAPFTFSYNRGSGDCSYPASKAESCTDDSRLVLKYQACPDVPSTESNVEELVCLAVWKEGSTRYLIGRISQGNRRNLISDEDQYRCFIYQRNTENGKTVYNIAQSGDATCNGLQNAFEGSRTMKLTTVDNHHNRCKFPLWITDHHTWLSLDHHKTYRFSSKNATLKILDDEAPKPNKVHQNYAFDFQEFGFESQDQRQQNSDMRLVCHMILQSHDHKKVQIVAHITSGCDSGYVCMMFYKRDSNVIELQQSENYAENPDDACANFNPTTTPYTTLITTTLHTKKCPHLGRYTLFNPIASSSEQRKKRQQPDDSGSSNQLSADCYSHNYEALAVGCGGSHGMEFRSSCAQQTISEYSCHGSWEENGISYVIASPVARKSTDALRYCFIYTLSNQPETTVIEGSLGKKVEPPILRLSGVSESCHRHVIPGVTGNWAFNFTSNGTCSVDNENSSPIAIPATLLVLLSALAALVIR
ncbi:uncharacterized protein LOC103313387 isoform X2 [Tribolium castaneum]|uniref:uncharacterized protein LOC103313387 isoform X2 n=1 Tax=Tribolium castaneum TaxID=7070 RepID=UPI00077D9D78|nr:PREDICTED: uncharacterized protein LOC103313387 isoform X2 [Tribolium castaneum]|eukprot:XP_015836364.1 PREDICTED: uncharacterized protein LOC103313387 isoform X2 [Tribolium castaneum]